MKNLKYIALLCVTVILTSCGRDFLEPEVKNYITEEEKNELQKDPKTLANLVTASIAINYNTLQGFWASHDDFGLRAFQLATDMMTATSLITAVGSSMTICMEISKPIIAVRIVRGVNGMMLLPK
ncbi:hypothetical protein [Porphyromonas macacae]|uniref:hypothetical protein n=1 Tax=Porphyromonas macacae TaxID=28115 RepID=UPI00046A7C42|nr:hypothetical protein [Porphyromonas macacae]